MLTYNYTLKMEVIALIYTLYLANCVWIMCCRSLFGYYLLPGCVEELGGAGWDVIPSEAKQLKTELWPLQA